MTPAAVDAEPYRAWRNKRAIWSWSLYDFADSAVHHAGHHVRLRDLFHAGDCGRPDRGTALWSRGVTITALIVAFCSPLLGALADRGGYRKLFVLVSTLDLRRRDRGAVQRAAGAGASPRSCSS